MSKGVGGLCSAVHKKRRVVLLLVILIGLIFLGVYPKQIWGFLLEIFAAFHSIETAREYIKSYGAFAPAVSALLMVFQSVIAPLPAFIITFANGALFGVWWGALLSWSSAMLGAAGCFYIARALGARHVAKLISQRAVEKTNPFFEKYGNYAVLIARLIPILSFDIVSYVAGLTRMRFLGFWIATGIGQLPATVVYAYLGERISVHTKLMLWGFCILISISIIIRLVKTNTSARRRASPSPSRRGF